MALISLRDISIRFRGPALLDGVDCEIESGQHIGLLGRNGAGKSTLMKILVGKQQPDSGQIVLAQGAKVGMLQQEVPTDTSGTIGQEVIKGLENDDRFADWEKERQRDKILNKMGLDADAQFAALSSGMKRRVLLAKALAPEPDVLLLDEPTNHLDVDTITWLENFLSSWKGTLIFVTHDRSFLQKLSNRILEIDRGKIFDWQCDYNTFLQRKEAALEAEEKQNALFDKKLAEEEAWIRQGIKARRTRNMGRVRALKAMREERKERREKVGKVNLKIDAGQKSGQLVAAVKDVSFAYDEKVIFQNFSTMIMRGDKVGVIGKNGAGKTTLLRTIAGLFDRFDGAISWDDRDLRNDRLECQSDLLFLGHKPGVKSTLTVLENLRFLCGLSVGVTETDLFEALAWAGLKGYEESFCHSLSAGQQRRVALARLYLSEAKLWVLDEAFTAIDLAGTAQLERFFETQAKERNRMIIFTTHHRPQIQGLKVIELGGSLDDRT